jgi:membrane protein
MAQDDNEGAAAPAAATHPRGLLALVSEAVQRLFADEAVPLAGNIAFRTVFSAFPFLIFLTALAGFFGSETQAQAVVEFLLGVAPPEIVRPLVPEIRSILTEPRTDLMSIAALLTLWSAMAGVDSVRVGLNRAYDLKEHRSLALLYVQSVLFVIGTAIVLFALSFLVVLAPVIIAFVRAHVPGMEEASIPYDTWRYPLALALLVGELTLAHMLLPARRQSLAVIWPGMVLTVLVWIALSALYSAYLLSLSTFALTYAGLAGIFAAMFFVYLAALVLILGGEVNRVLALHRAGAAAAPTMPSE